MLFLVTALLVFISQFLLPDWWWVCMAACAISSLLVSKSSFNAFFSGFFGVFCVWLGYILFVNSQNEGLLLGRVSSMFGLGKELFILINTLLGGVMGGLSALTAYYFKAMWKKVED